MELKRVVVTGMGALTPIGNNWKEYTENLIKGVSGAQKITRFDASKFKTQFACEIKNYDPLDYFDKKEVRKYDRYSQYAMVAADEAIADSQLDLEKINLKRAGVILGVGLGGIDTFMDGVSNFAQGDGTPKFNPFFIPKMIGNIAGGLISIRHGLKGPNFTTTSACTSSANAIVDAVNYIRLGKADVIVTGGAEAPINETGVGGFNSMKAISTRNDDPKSASRPFDVDRDGFVIGEGAGILILEDYEHAKARGAKIYGEVAGVGINADAYHMTAPHPDGEGAKDVMLLAVEDAGMKPEEVDYINVHGTSTGLGDIAEPRAIKLAFGEHAYDLNISSTKSMTGHLLGGAGAIEAIASIYAVANDIVPPTINLDNLDPEIDDKLNFTPNEAQKRTVDVAISNTFGFGGHNASILFKKFKA
ncbi:3-oxoacyl-[acyl-carrier-protein] synthase II [Balneicella halophila]|uniref:3-oxoacyl-[acyl-carrier-protein] synthase 2 n=1 Tax=Balneicella halophila TaxID=1537566 RepID=A0A7L4UPV9_BALHA|nr:beta-ketoacyl-ACP synthase II [Balneicella halophila]PVX51825.1 3-oxoacyl-[acyl-carrier-protein] synthase II [Balneicella halophila]